MEAGFQACLGVAGSSVTALDETPRVFRHVRCDATVRSTHRRNTKAIIHYKHAQNPSTDISAAVGRASLRVSVRAGLLLKSEMALFPEKAQPASWKHLRAAN